MNLYAKVIDLLEEHLNSESDQRKILVEIAKTHPGLFYKVCDKVFPKKKCWQEVVIPLLKAACKIDAIRECRAYTGMGLKEAKEACEQLQENEYRY